MKTHLKSGIPASLPPAAHSLRWVDGSFFFFLSPPFPLPTLDENFPAATPPGVLQQLCSLMFHISDSPEVADSLRTSTCEEVLAREMRKASRRSAGTTDGGEKKGKRKKRERFYYAAADKKEDGKMEEPELRKANRHPLMLALTNPSAKMVAWNVFTQADEEEIRRGMSFPC